MSTEETPMQYAGRVIRSEVERVYGGVYRMAEAASISSSSIYRVIRGQKAADDAEVGRIERALGWPRGSVAVLARQDFAELLAIGVDADLVRHAQSLVADGGSPPPAERRAADRRRAG
jgi:hypothetical protein